MLYAVAAAVIGGTSLFGGRGKMLGAVLGGIIVAVIYNGLQLLGLGAAAAEPVDRGRPARRRHRGHRSAP